jgi:hypothetical protein
VPARRDGRGKLAVAAFAIAMSIAAAAAQDVTPPGLLPDEPAAAIAAPSAVEHDSIQVPSGGRPLVVARLAAIPRQLKAAIDRANCPLTEALAAQYPVLIFRPADGRRLMAVVPCFDVVPGSRAFLFDRSVEQEPSPMTFPIVAPTGGFSASQQPGLMTWESLTRTLTAWRGSDQCPAREVRHVYRQGSGELNGFALSKVEHRRLRCTTPEADWLTLWQSPAWNLGP